MTKESVEPIVNPARHKFDQVLNTIANHTFVTPESLEKRASLGRYVNYISSILNRLGCDKVVCFPAGSIAVGMAVEESDVDGQIFYEHPEPFEESYSSDLTSWYLGGIKVEEEEGVEGEVEIEPVSNYINEEFIRDSIVETFDGSVNFFPENLAIFFYPSLNEFSDPNEKEIVNSWRKQILESIVTTDPQNAEKYWDVMRVFLKSQLILYENTEGKYFVPAVNRELEVTTDPKRQARVNNILNAAIKERFPGLSQFERAKSFVHNRRVSLDYPTFNEMLEAFDINRSILDKK